MGHRNVVTADELSSHGDIGPCELVEGELVMMAPSGGKHGKVAMQIGRLLAEYVANHQLGEVSAAETGFLITRAPDSVRAPDVGFIDKARVPEDGPPDSYWPFAPDLAVEVVSPADRWSQVEEKTATWLEAGTLLVWVVDPRNRTVYVYHPGKEVLRLTEEDQLSGGDVVPGFALPVSELFS